MRLPSQPTLEHISLCNRHRRRPQRWHDLVWLERHSVFLIDLDAMRSAVGDVHPPQGIDADRHGPMEALLWFQTRSNRCIPPSPLIGLHPSVAALLLPGGKL